MKKNIPKILILVSITSVILGSGCGKIFPKPHDQLIKNPGKVCKKPPFYVNGKRVYGAREQR